MRFLQLLTVCFATLAIGTSQVSAQVLFSSELDTDSGWTIVAEDDTDYEFGFDYTTLGIPKNPNNPADSTTGDVGDDTPSGESGDPNVPDPLERTVDRELRELPESPCAISVAEHLSAAERKRGQHSSAPRPLPCTRELTPTPYRSARCNGCK